MHRLHRAAAGWARRAATVARTHTAQGGVRWSGAAAGLALAAIGTATAARHTTSLANEGKTSCCHSQAATKQPATSGATPLQLAQAELIALLGSERVSSEASDLTTHTSDAFSYHKSEAAEEDAAGTLRGLVVYPLSTEEVSAVVKICVRHRVTMIPYGSGTSLEGHTSAPLGGVYIDLSQMQSLRALHVGDMDCVVDPGLSWNNLNAELKEHGLFYPVDPGPGASLGGMAATNCSGTNAVRYGTMKQNILNLTVVLPDGTIVKTGNRARKSSAGYDLTRFFIGSEGTLGIVTELTLRLSSIPPAQAVATCSFDSVGEASRSVQEVLQQGVRVGCVELLDDGCIAAVNSYAGLTYPLKPATLFFKFTGASQAGVQDDIDQVGSIVQRHGAGPFTFATEPAARDSLWEARKGALWGCIAYRPGCEAWTTDVCVPISRLAECIEQTKEDLVRLSGPSGITNYPIVKNDAIAPAKGVAASSTAVAPAASSTTVSAAASSSASGRSVSFPSAVVGHVGDGNFHVIMMLDPSNPLELAVAKEVNERMVARAIAMEGTCTGEHGVGIGKKKYLEAELGPEAINLMRTMKRTLDPYNLMNPGKVFDMDPSAQPKKCGMVTNAAAHKTKHGGCC